MGRRNRRAGRDAPDAGARALGGIQRADSGTQIRRLPNVRRNATTKTRPFSSSCFRALVVTAMTYAYLMSRRDGAVEYLTLNRPDVRNAFNEHVIAELTAWAAQAREQAARREIRVVVLGGAGKTFCAGADVTWMSKPVHYTEDENLRDATAMSRMFAALDALPVPVVGRI